VLALDVGTSSVRALLFDLLGRPVPGALAQIAYRPRVDAQGAAEVDAGQLVGLTWRAIQALLGATRQRLADAPVRAVSISTFWHSLLASDGSGQPLTPIYLWADSRSWREAQELRETVDAEAVRHRTGCLVHPSYWPAKLAWLRKLRPDLWSRPVRWLSFADLLHWRLFGAPLSSVSMASGTGLFELEGLRWDRELCSILQVPTETLPQLGDVSHGLLAPFASRWPELATVPWLTAMGDGALANLGSACADTEHRALTVGTSGALRVLYSGRPPERLPDGLWCYRLDARRPVVGGALSSGGNIYAWLVATLAVDVGTLGRQVARIPPTSHGLTFLPHLAGERSPGFALHATGAVAGLTLATTPVQIVRAGLESIAIEFARIDGRLDQVLPSDAVLVANGHGLLSSPGWMQIMADAIGKPLAAERGREASARGAAVMALEHLGLLALERLRPSLGRSFTPVPDATRLYRRQLAKQEALYRLLVEERALDPRPPSDAESQPRGRSEPPPNR
jgi:gluconokinase